MFRNYFYRETGVYFDESKRYFVDRRILDRMLFLNAPSFQNYFSRLRWGCDRKELETLIHMMTVHETYFFRELYQLDCMVNHLLQERHQIMPQNEIVNIWSAGCSTGEEAYSIAIYLLERWTLIKERDVRIYASDIDFKVLQKAQEGIFNHRSVNSLPSRYLEKYFTALNSDHYQIQSDLRQSVHFFQTNLCDSIGIHLDYHSDIIFCRNVLIYFDENARKNVIKRFFTNLKPGGFLCLGHSESLHRTQHEFIIRKFPDAVVYQKPFMDQ